MKKKRDDVDIEATKRHTLICSLQAFHEKSILELCAVSIMRRVFLTLLAALLTAARELTDDDPDSDPAGFMIVVEHEDGYYCSASLVSIRTGVTTARCARGRGSGERRELWALAARLVSARPPVPLAAAARRVTRIALAGDGNDPDDPALDMALLELESPFEAEALSKPILMATSRDACDYPPVCHTIHALPPLTGGRSKPGRRVRLRVVGLKTAKEDRCNNRVPHWAVSRARMMCLTGSELCERDLGGGVVCDGKLCGVLSAVVGEGDGFGRDMRDSPVCGNIIAAQSVAHWRRFIHCAYTLRLCGSGACAGQCTEQRLLEDEKTVYHSTNAVNVSTQTTELIRATVAESSISWKDFAQEVVSEPNAPTHTDGNIDTKSASFHSYVFSSSYSTHSASTLTTRLSTQRPLVTPSPSSIFDRSIEPQPSLRPFPEFEPNRPDFKAAPIQPTRVGLKAGEYGDNAADYSGEEIPAGMPCTSAPLPVPTPRRLPPPPAPLSAPAAPPAPALQAPADEKIATSRTCPVNSPCALLLCIVMCFLEYCSQNK